MCFHSSEQELDICNADTLVISRVFDEIDKSIKLMREITLHCGKFRLTLQLLRQQLLICTREIRLESDFVSSVASLSSQRLEFYKSHILLLFTLLHDR